jgi:hypothetical protein
MTKLSILTVILGALVAVKGIYGLAQPVSFSAALRKFPRSLPWGYALMLFGTAWFVYNVSQESIADFASYKNVLLAVFAAIGIGSCFFVQDFLAVRGLAIVLLLLGKLLVDIGRPRLPDSAWVLVIQVWAYLMVIAGMWLTISPWRLRDMVNWVTADPKRLKLACGVRLAFGLLIVALGLVKF